MENKAKSKTFDNKKANPPQITKSVKDKHSRDDLDSSQSSSTNVKNEINTSITSIASPIQTKNNENRTITTIPGMGNSQENVKLEQIERTSNPNSHENSLIVTQHVPITSTSQNNPQLHTQTPTSGVSSIKAVKKKDVSVNSPKTSISRESIKSVKLTMTPTKGGNKAAKEKADVPKKMGADNIHDSPSKGANITNTSAENFSDNDSPSHSRSHSIKHQDIDISRYYKKERGKINIWTYLFMNLNKSINEIYTMCDMENVLEFNNGVISTLEGAIEDLKKLNKKIELENSKDAKALAWEIPGTHSEIQNQQDLENFVEDLEDPENVDFTLLTQLINEGKMSFYEAIVLMVRERALLIDDNLTQISQINSDNGSFISKVGGDFFLDYQKDIKDIKDGRDESLMAPISITQDSQELLRRSRSQTPGRVSLAKLITRLNWKLHRQAQAIEEDEEERKEEYKSILVEKQLKAEIKRKDLEELKVGYLKRENQKVIKAREKVAEKQVKRWETVSKKLDEAEERHEERLTNIKKKAQNETNKVNEVAFITLLENKTKKMTLDQKLKETHERRIQIIEKIKKKQSDRIQKEEAVNKRREAMHKGVQLGIGSKLKSKLEEAELRRLKILEEKKKASEEERKRVININEKKKKTVDFSNPNDSEPNTYKHKIFVLKNKLLKEQEKLNNGELQLTNEEDELQVDTSIVSDDLPLTTMLKKNKSTLLGLEAEDYVTLDEFPIVFYEPKSKQKAIQNTVTASTESQDPKKKKKKKGKTQPKKDEDEYLPIIIRSFSEPQLKVSKFEALFVSDKENIKEESSAPKDNLKTTRESIRQKEVKTTKDKADTLIITGIKSPKDSKEPKAIKQTEISFTKKTSLKPKSSIEIITPVEEKKLRSSISSQAKKDPKEKEDSLTLNPKESTSAPNVLEKPIVKKPEEDILDKNKLEDDKSNEKILNLEESKENLPIEESKEDDIIIRWCSICDLILDTKTEDEEHISSKSHRKMKTQYNLSSTDDVNCVFEFKSSDAASKLKAERLNTLKKRCKKVKQRLLTKALKHENACIVGKEVTSINKQRLQKLCSELDKQLLNQMKDYELVENTLKDILKLLEIQREADLHIMRQLKFLPILMEISKRVPVCHKNEMNAMLKVLELAIKILAKFCGLIDNRTYMILTNRLVPLVDLLIWCLNRPTKFVYSLTFVPTLFTILGRHLNHRLPSENIGYREDLIEYIFCSGLIVKLQQKFMSFNSGLDLTTSMGKVPLALLKSVSFLETLTSVIDAELDNDRSIFEPPELSENVSLVLKETEFVGMFSLLASLLLSDGTYVKQPTKALPQTVLSLAMTTVKFFNNIGRLMLEPLQKVLGSELLQESVYHVFSYLLNYCIENYDSSEDVKDLLDELILLIGYFSVLNPNNQQLLGKGMSTIIQKLGGLPFQYFTDKKLKDVLFPTLFSAVYKVERNLEILYQEVSKDHLEKYLQSQIQLFPFETILDEGQNTPNNKNSSPCESKTDEKLFSTKLQDTKYLRAPSVSSNNSSTTSLFNVKSSNSIHFMLIRRLPRKEWNSLLQFINSK